MHIGFIMDGNRRYGKKHNLETSKAYERGLNKFLQFVSLQIKYKIDEISFFALSHDNYIKRPEGEKGALAGLINTLANNEEVEKFFTENKIKINILGNLTEMDRKDKILFSKFNNSVKKLKEKVESWNSSFEKESFTVNLAINYDGHTELVNAMKKIANKIEKGEIKKSKINEKLIKQNLWFTGKSADIIVRTGDAPRLSGFMLWDSKYSEIYLTKKLWPELDESDLIQILDWFKNIKRNFGK